MSKGSRGAGQVWHVYAAGEWRTETVPAGRTAPVNVFVTATRTAPVEYRHREGECWGECRLVCGHPVGHGCACDAIAAGADGQDRWDVPVRVERRTRTFNGTRYMFERTVWADDDVTIRAYRGTSGAVPFREWTACGMWTDPAYLGS